MLKLSIGSREVKSGRRTVAVKWQAEQPLKSARLVFHLREKLGQVVGVNLPWTLDRVVEVAGHHNVYAVTLPEAAEDATSGDIELEVEFAEVVAPVNGSFVFHTDESTIDPVQELDSGDVGGFILTPFVRSVPTREHKPEPAYEPNEISLPSALTVAQGTRFQTPVRIDDATGVKSVTFDVYYPGHALVPDDFQVAAPFGNWAYLGNLKLPDQVRIGMSIGGRNPTLTGPHRLGSIVWVVRRDAPPGKYSLDLDHASRRDVEGGFKYSSKDTALTIVAAAGGALVETPTAPRVVGSADELKALRRWRGRGLKRLASDVQKLDDRVRDLEQALEFNE